MSKSSLKIQLTLTSTDPPGVTIHGSTYPIISSSFVLSLDAPVADGRRFISITNAVIAVADELQICEQKVLLPDYRLTQDKMTCNDRRDCPRANNL